VVSGGLATPLVGTRVGFGMPVAVGVAVAVAVSVAVTVGVSVGLGVCVMVGVGVSGSEVGLGSVGIKVGRAMVGENKNPANAIIEMHRRIARTARIPNFGHDELRKGFLCLLGDVGIQKPFTGRSRCKRRAGSGIIYLLTVKKAMAWQGELIIPIHFAREKGQSWRQDFYKVAGFVKASA
jgi:hypothetical protein